MKKFCKSTTVIGFERIKWAEGFGFVEVDAVMKVLYDIDKKHRGEEGFGYYFVRVGEEFGDVEERYSKEVSNIKFYPSIFPETRICMPVANDGDKLLGD
ncbi:hypothetical protein [uncultured Treponema sp.]|uniref:hypothetical protein n=1 Tax=uncultured Treponema sp. TaxID=162155 RepID=UPI0025FD13E4|nr:hypothetical protein [uncultured Treponema sp.]